jgi:hypothetical protein
MYATKYGLQNCRIIRYVFIFHLLTWSRQTDHGECDRLQTTGAAYSSQAHNPIPGIPRDTLWFVIFPRRYLFVCFALHEQFFSYLASVTITGDRTANLDLCLALTVFSIEGSFTCHTYCDTGPLFLRSYPKDPWFSLLDTVLLAKKQITTYFNRLRFGAAGPSGARAHDLPDVNRGHYH